MRVTLLADHRLIDGVPAARALAALEATLTGDIQRELITLAAMPRASG
jgi:pyruvate/2-oxoglutarate dehydrogenase complex dihydrolipoamide acyltransferase (E2) component